MVLAPIAELGPDSAALCWIGRSQLLTNAKRHQLAEAGHVTCFRLRSHASLGWEAPGHFYSRLWLLAAGGRIIYNSTRCTVPQVGTAAAGGRGACVPILASPATGEICHSAWARWSELRQPSRRVKELTGAG